MSQGPGGAFQRRRPSVSRAEVSLGLPGLGVADVLERTLKEERKCHKGGMQWLF